jgi:protein involved in polysaccharide export with SLBB domain
MTACANRATSLDFAPLKQLRCTPYLGLMLLTAVLTLPLTPAWAGDSNGQESVDASSGPVRLSTSKASAADASTVIAVPPPKAAPYKPGEFELYVNKLLGWDGSSSNTMTDEMPVKRLGAELVSADASGLGSDSPRQIPQDYVLGIGDEVLVTLWGSVDADLRLTVDNGGRIVIPRVGPVMVAGLRYGELNDAINRRVGQVFRNYQVSSALGRLRGIRVYVTGFTPKPGAYNLSSLSTIVTALMRAGGPSAAGSFRNIELRRSGQVISHFDLYELLLKGNKSADAVLQAEDVIHIGAAGPQVAILGSINKPVIVEIKPGEHIDDALAMAGGFNPVADRSRIAIERLSERNDRRVTEITLPASNSAVLTNGDVLRVFSSVGATLPQYKQYKRVHIEGEVAKPGDYVLPPMSTLNDALKAAGGLTPQAYVFGTDFSRESVRQTQQDNYERALRDMETSLTRSSTSQKTSTADEAAGASARASNANRLIERLRAVKPTGRIVLQLEAAAVTLPDLAVEDGDKLTIPSQPNTVGVFGSVYNGGSYLLRNRASIDDFVRQAGGPTKGADKDSTFVVRANGSVVSTQQSSSGWFSAGNALSNVAALPGDTVFVPEDMAKGQGMQDIKDWTQIIYQFGLGAAALKTIKN